MEGENDSEADKGASEVTLTSNSKEYTYMLDRCKSCGNVTPRWQRTPTKDRKNGEIRGVPLLHYDRCSICAAAVHASQARDMEVAA